VRMSLESKLTFQCIARKVFKRSKELAEKDIANEVKAMDELCRGSHPNIIEIYSHGKLQDGSESYYIDMELCDCNLRECIDGCEFPPRLLSRQSAIEVGEGPFFVCCILYQIASGLKFIHSHGKVHRDLSPQNSTPPYPSTQEPIVSKIC
jgi:serine/threonine protein kinase